MSRKNDEISQIGKEILQAIKNQRLTKTEVCQKMGISRSTLYSWISGETAPDHTELKKLYEILNIGPSQQSFKHQIFEGDYVGMHKRAWDQLDESYSQARAMLTQIVANNTRLAEAMASLVQNNSELTATVTKLIPSRQKH